MNKVVPAQAGVILTSMHLTSFRLRCFRTGGGDPPL